MTIVGTIMRIIGTLIVLLIIAVGAVYLSDPIKYGRYISALPIFPKLSVTMEWYEPKGPVKGVDAPIPIPTAAESEKTISQSALDQMVAWNEDKSTISLLVAHKGKIQLERYWPGYDAGIVSDTASMHKSIIGIMYGYALEDGEIQTLDEPIARYLPEWANDPRGKITIRNLMQMSSGLKTDPFNFSPFSRSSDFFFGSDLVKTSLETEYASPPGEEFQYLNANSQILTLILERTTGKTIAQYESEKLWQPLGAADANVWLDREGGLAHGYCCFHTTPREWLRLGMMLANGGRVDGRQVVSPPWLEMMTTPAATNPQYGLQVWLGTDFVGGRKYNKLSSLAIAHDAPMAVDDMFYFDGAIGQRVYVIPSKELVIVRTGTGFPVWEESFLPNTAIAGIIEPEPVAEIEEPAPLLDIIDTLNTLSQRSQAVEPN